MFATNGFSRVTIRVALACFLCVAPVGRPCASAAKPAATDEALRLQIRNLAGREAGTALLGRLGYTPAAVERAAAGASREDLAALRDCLRALTPRAALTRRLVAEGYTSAKARGLVAELTAEEIERVVRCEPERGGYFIIPTAYWIGLFVFTAAVAVSDLVDLTPWNQQDDRDSIVMEFVREQYLKQKERRLKAKMLEQPLEDLRARDETRRLEEMLLRRGEEPDLPPL